MEPNSKVVIGWIDGGLVHTGFAAYLSQILLNRSDRIESVVASSSAYLSDNRNSMVKTFLENTEAEWLLSLDSDLCVDIDSFDELIKLADKDTRPIIGGKYFLPFEHGKRVVVAASTWDLLNPGQYIFINDWSGTEPIDNLHAVGLGFALIHRSIFERVAEMYPGHPKPWFQDEYRDDLKTWVSDDINFFEKVHKLGDVNVTLCTKATSVHLKTFRVSEDTFIDVQNPKEASVDMGAHKKISWWAKGKGHSK